MLCVLLSKSLPAISNQMCVQVRVLFVGNLLPKMGFGLETRLAAYRWLEYTTFAFVTVAAAPASPTTTERDGRRVAKSEF